MGGSFNPIHKSHLGMIRKTLDRRLIDEMWLVPCKDHAFGKDLASEHHRLKMIELATKGMENVKINTYELDKEGKSYTSDTMKHFQKNYPHEFYLVIGSDLLKDIKRWNDYDYIKTLKFIIFKRGGNGTRSNLDMIVLDNVRDISSTNIVEMFLKGEDISEYVPKDVADYITKNDVYVDKRISGF